MSTTVDNESIRVITVSTTVDNELVRVITVNTTVDNELVRVITHSKYCTRQTMKTCDKKTVLHISDGKI